MLTMCANEKTLYVGMKNESNICKMWLLNACMYN